MYVCVCRAVTDSKIEELVEGGCKSLSDLQQKVSICNQCCSCKESIEKIMDEKQQKINL